MLPTLVGRSNSTWRRTSESSMYTETMLGAAARSTVRVKGPPSMSTPPYFMLMVRSPKVGGVYEITRYLKPCWSVSVMLVHTTPGMENVMSGGTTEGLLYASIGRSTMTEASPAVAREMPLPLAVDFAASGFAATILVSHEEISLLSRLTVTAYLPAITMSTRAPVYTEGVADSTADPRTTVTAAARLVAVPSRSAASIK
mmetsp:Transcript_25363/g.80260  ORF Transcript_25363/g.80260 Transcript_25363/m.80260 type:complete len:200 (+) Transcript_25363:3420-4019(+)